MGSKRDNRPDVAVGGSPEIGGYEPEFASRELRELLQEVLPLATGGRWIERQPLSEEAFRLCFEADGRAGSFIVKALAPETARRSQRAAQQWLSAVGVEDAAPSLLGVAADRSGQRVWHVYEDLGDGTLDETAPEPQGIEAAVSLIAQIHTRSAERPFLAECRLWGTDFGIAYYSANVRDAIRCLEAVVSSRTRLGTERTAVGAALMDQLHALREEEEHRARALAEFGGPETFLHGDFWPQNVVLVATGNGPRARLVDWDRAGVGPVSYDLSAFLLRFPAADRLWILDQYRVALARAGWRLPEPSHLNLLFDTAERARVSNRIIWAALAACGSEAEWGFDELARCSEWLERLGPVLPL